MLSSAWQGILSMVSPNLNPTPSTANPTIASMAAPSESQSVTTPASSTLPPASLASLTTTISTTPITPEEIASSDTISDLKLSKDGTHLIYTSGPLYKVGEHKLSALWVADTLVGGSARQITSGANRDWAPTFHPHSSSPSWIYFLSDREEAGGSAHLFRLSVDLEHLDRGSGLNLNLAKLDKEVKPVVTLNDKESVTSYSVSPDGKFLAFTLEKKTTKKGEKEGILVWREEKHLQTLNIVDLSQALGEDHTPIDYRTVKSINAHVESFSWSPDSTSILYRTISHLDIEARSEAVQEGIVSVSTHEIRDTYTHVQQPSGPSIWRAHGGEQGADTIAFVHRVSSSQFCSAKCLWSRKVGENEATRVAYGQDNDVGGILDLGTKSQYVVEVVENLITKLDVYSDTDTFLFTAFETTPDHAISAWDMVLTQDDRYVFVAKKSSVISGEVDNIWSGVTELGKTGTLSEKLSSHNAWFESKVPPDGKVLSWTASDGVRMEGVVNYPRGIELKGLPTVVVIHGGPMSRDVLDLNFSFSRWRPFLATHGYLVLSPNYRGGTGRGNAFAMAASGGVGGREWLDIEEMIEEGIKQGLVDPNRIGITGYSQGGFLSAWGVTRPKNRFNLGVIGAGVTDWGILAATSDIPDAEAEFGGSAPWTPGEPLYLKGSPLRDAHNVTAPILFLHGKSDVRVPVSQAIALLRGIEREAKVKVPPELVIYPREDHGFEERANAQDILKRLLDHITKHL